MSGKGSCPSTHWHCRVRASHPTDERAKEADKWRRSGCYRIEVIDRDRSKDRHAKRPSGVVCVLDAVIEIVKDEREADTGHEGDRRLE